MVDYVLSVSGVLLMLKLIRLISGFCHLMKYYLIVGFRQLIAYVTFNGDVVNFDDVLRCLMWDYVTYGELGHDARVINSVFLQITFY
jgi:hypothetical protein